MSPAASQPWTLALADHRSFLPPVSYLVDLMPGILVFGAGLTILVAPLTATIMGSVPVANSGVASAINNAISRIGPQLAGAAIFVGVTSLFYRDLGRRLPGLDTTSAAVRAQLSPLNPPHFASAAQAVAAVGASTDAFHLAMLASAGLLLLGGLINAVGIRRIPDNAIS